MLLRQGAFCGHSLLHVPEPSRRFYTSSRTKPKVLHVIPNQAEGACEGSPRLLQPVPCKGIPRFADFAPLGLVRRFVEMLLQAGISPRVGRNDEKGEAGVMRRRSLRRRERCHQRRRMKGQTKKQFPFFPPHQSLRDSFPPKGKPYALPIMPQGKSRFCVA